MLFFEVFDPPSLRLSIHLTSNFPESNHIELPYKHEEENVRSCLMDLCNDRVYWTSHCPLACCERLAMITL